MYPGKPGHPDIAWEKESLHRSQEQVCATSSLKMSRKAFAIKSSKDLKTSLKTENLSHSKALNQLKVI